MHSPARIQQGQQEADLKRLARVKQTTPPTGSPLGPEMIDFFKHSVQKRQSKLTQIAECWARLVPEMLSEHSALESFSRGTLTVVLDSSSHKYELQQLLLAGLQQQLLMACKATGLRKINLKHGRWYDASSAGEQRDRKIRFHS